MRIARMKLMMLCFLLFLATSQNVVAQKLTALKQDKQMLKLVDSSLNKAVAQYKILMKGRIPGKISHSANKQGAVRNVPPTGWVSGFYPGTMAYLYGFSKDKSFAKEIQECLVVLDSQQYNKNTHDLGFMMYCSFGTAYKYWPKTEYKTAIINSARSLASRYNDKVHSILSWGSMSNQKEFLVIIDNMMNLELLFNGAKFASDLSLRELAITHANTTLANHFRPDNSSYHVVNYNPLTGDVLRKYTAQGFSDSSAWARGQAWGLYGYTVMYRETGEQKYLDQANKIAEFILSNPNLPADKIPYWDYNSPDIPNAKRDASAGAIACSALIELARYNRGDLAKKQLNAAETMIKSLSSPAYTAP